MLHSIFHWFLHYTGSSNVSGPWYGFFSGFGSDLGELTLIGGAYVLIRRHNCHVKGCKSIITHLDPTVHAPACRTHHSHAHLRGRTHDHTV